MIGDDRRLPKLYRELAQDERNFSQFTNGIHEMQDIEELKTLFTQMTEQSLGMAKKMSMASALHSLKNETINYVLANSS
ncbi:hypothetical protein BLL37_26255 [Pseudomonas azotoformans]|uniref:Uncharacterized protein n=1 Tax=Pseudomonas azotoformans TaxID=47878 RepID=A0A1V2J892_PSEAZ|nr:hypothetical protein [Pseudomonas azotoformans]OIN48846.1 hypothetical protein BFL39_13185 [Pseudomonas azotoformans]ONH41657.1 hypothetical protein BLL37_26255 [Pseudomonas azotoformans]SDO66208.1 hypothetical protein SAMN04489799_5188 [Pseudomonas azotoformans]